MVAALPALTRLIAGISVPNTALINSSIALAQENMPVQGFNHVMRAWLNGQAMINHMSKEEQKKIDVEAFGVATILHDMGWLVHFHFVIVSLSTVDAKCSNTIKHVGHSTPPSSRRTSASKLTEPTPHATMSGTMAANPGRINTACSLFGMLLLCIQPGISRYIRSWRCSSRAPEH